eukprot:5871919-Pleurochrysis_carterae.AAC.6
MISSPGAPHGTKDSWDISLDSFRIFTPSLAHAAGHARTHATERRPRRPPPSDLHAVPSWTARVARQPASTRGQTGSTFGGMH